MSTAAIEHFASNIGHLLVKGRVHLYVYNNRHNFTRRVMEMARAFLFRLTNVNWHFHSNFTDSRLLARRTRHRVRAFTSRQFATFASGTIRQTKRTNFIVNKGRFTDGRRPPNNNVGGR